MRRTTFNDPGHAHELTFSTYRRTRLFEDDGLCRLFLEKLDAARRVHRYEVWAYVLMPDHVHLLVFPKERAYDVSAFRRLLKQAVAREALSALRAGDDPVLGRLCHGPDGAPRALRFWQPGAGYDRNLHSSKACRRSIDYVHDNPVVAGLCAHPCDWEFSSARAYRGDDCSFKVDFPAL